MNNYIQIGSQEELNTFINNNYTQKQIAEVLFTTQPQYYRYEKGLRDLPCEHLVILAKFYNVSADYILGLTDKEK